MVAKDSAKGLDIQTFYWERSLFAISSSDNGIKRVVHLIFEVHFQYLSDFRKLFVVG